MSELINKAESKTCYTPQFPGQVLLSWPTFSWWPPPRRASVSPSSPCRSWTRGPPWMRRGPPPRAGGGPPPDWWHPGGQRGGGPPPRPACWGRRPPHWRWWTRWRTAWRPVLEAQWQEWRKRRRKWSPVRFGRNRRRPQGCRPPQGGHLRWSVRGQTWWPRWWGAPPPSETMDRIKQFIFKYIKIYYKKCRILL